MDYTFVRDGVPEAVELERWGWGVVYKDGTELKQFGDDGTFHQFKEVVQENVAMFVMYNTGDPVALKKRIDIPVVEGMQIFHFYRIVVLAGGSGEERRVRCFVFGWKLDGATTYTFILPDDRIIVSPTDAHKLTEYDL